MSLEKLAILIPTRNRPKILAVTLAELKKLGLDKVALWVYDDASDQPAAVREAVLNAYPYGQIIRGSVRSGAAAGRNILMRACKKEYGLFLDDDSFPSSSEGLTECLDLDPKKTRRAVTTFQYQGMADGKFSLPPSQPSGPVTSFLGGASIFHIPSILEAGGYRDLFVYGYEEPELAMRLWLKGYQVWYDSQVVINHNHFEKPDERRDHNEYAYLNIRNCLLMSSLNMPLWIGLPYGAARATRLALCHRKNFRGIISGFLAAIGMSFSLWRERTPCRTSEALAWCRFVKAHRI